MANHRKDITGEKFGMLTAVKPVRTNERGSWIWLFECECGGTTERLVSTMLVAKKSGKKSHCGCSPALKTHGLSKRFQKLNWVWTAMKQRCYNPECKDFPHYGGRGITVCEDWHNFESFHAWAMSSGYREKVTIERIDVNGHYCPENCTWVKNERQPLNRTNTLKYEYKGEMYDIRELSELSGVNYYTLKGRLTHYGWTVERAISEPSFKGKNQTYKGPTKC